MPLTADEIDALDIEPAAPRQRLSPQEIDSLDFTKLRSEEPSRGGYLTEAALGLTQLVPGMVKSASVIGEKLLDRPALGVGPSGRAILRSAGVETDGVPESRPLYRFGQDMQEKLEAAYPAVPEGERNLGHDVVRGLGQVGSMVAGGLAAKAAGATVKGAAVVGTALGFGQEFDDAYSRARQRGDDPDTSLAKSLGYATVSALIENKLGAGRILRKYFPDPAEAAKKLSALGVAKSVGTSLAVGFGEEGSQRFAQNWIVEGEPSLEGVVQEGAPGGIVQAIAELPANLLRGRGRIRSSLPRPERKPDEETASPIIPEEAAIRQPPSDQEVLGSQEGQSQKQLGLRRVVAGDTEPEGPAAAQEEGVAATPQSIATATGFTYAPAFGTEGMTPEQTAQMAEQPWHFTDQRPDSPTRSMSVSVPRGSTLEQLQAAIDAKLKEGFTPPVIPPSVNAQQGPAPVAGATPPAPAAPVPGIQQLYKAEHADLVDLQRRLEEAEKYEPESAKALRVERDDAVQRLEQFDKLHKQSPDILFEDTPEAATAKALRQNPRVGMDAAIQEGVRQRRQDIEDRIYDEEAIPDSAKAEFPDLFKPKPVAPATKPTPATPVAETNPVGSFVADAKDSTGTWIKETVSVLSIGEPVKLSRPSSDGGWQVTFEAPSALGKTGRQTRTRNFFKKADALAWIDEVRRGKPTAPPPPVGEIKTEQQDTFRAKAEELAQRLEKLKLQSPGGTQMVFFPGLDPASARALWNTAIDAAQVVLRATGRIADAIDAAIQSIRQAYQGEFDEAAARAELEAGLSSEPPPLPPTSEEQRPVHQVLGVPMGADKAVQPMQPIKDFVRLNYFDGTQPIAPEQTERARDLIRRMADPAEKGIIIQEISEVAGPDMQAVGTMLVNELADYSTRLAIAGDLSLGREVVRNWHQFGELPSGSGKAAIGRALRAVQEAVSYRFYQTAYDMLKEGGETARRAAGVGEELWQRLVATMRDLRIDLAQFNTTPFDTIIPTVTPEQQTERERVTLEEEGREAESKTEQYAQRLANRLELTEWPGNTAQTNEVKRVINEFLKSQPPLSQTLSVEPLAQALVGVGVTPETANRLAYQIFTQRERQWAGARVRAMRRAAARQGNLRALIEEIQATPYLAQKDPAWRKQTAEEWFMSAGLSREQAQEAAKLFDEQFQSALKRAAQVEAERVLEGSKLSPATKDTILRAIRSGLLDPSSEWYGELLKEKGIQPLSDADFKRLAELDQKLSNPDLSTPEKSEITDQIFTIWRRLGSPPDILTRLASNLVVTNLTGFPTAGVNIFAPQTLNFLELGLTAISSPRDFGVMLKAMLDAGKTWLAENRFSLTRDAYSFINNDFAHSQNTLKGIWERGLKQVQGKRASDRTKGAINLIFGAQQYAMRLLSSLDNANGLMKRQTQLALYASQAMRHLGFTTKDIQDVVDMMYLMKEQFYALGIEAGLTNNQATVRANDLATQAFRDFLDNKVGDTLGNDIYRSAELDGYSILGRLGPNIQELEEGGLVSRTLGIPILKLSNWMRQQPGMTPALGVALLGYVNVPYRATRFAAWNSPYGLLRLGINRWRKSTGRENWWKQSLATEQQERYRFKQALASTAVMALVTGLGVALAKTSADDGAGDDDDDGVYFTGSGPKNKNLRSAWMARGFKPNSMVFFFGGRYAAIPMTRAGEPLAHFAWILSARDQKAWRDKEAAATGRTIEPDITKEAAHAVGAYLGLMGQRGFLQTLFQAGQVSAGAEDPRRFAASKGASFVSGLVTPYLGLQRSFVNLLQGPADTSSITSAMAANFPVLGLVGDTFRKPLLNRLGDPLYNPENSWYHKMYYTGAPIAFGVSDSSNNRTTYGLLVDKGVSPPELRRGTVEEKYGPLDNDQFREFAETSGRLIKQELISNEPTLRNQTPEEVKKWLNKTAASADRVTAIGMKLEPVTPPKPRAAAAVQSILATPAIYGGRTSTSTPRSYRSGRIRSSLGGGRASRTRLTSMKVPKLKRGRVRGSMRRRGRIRTSSRRVRRPRIYA